MEMVDPLPMRQGVWARTGDGLGGRRLRGGSAGKGSPDLLEDLEAVDRNGTWGIDTDLDLVAPDIDDHDFDVVPDHDLLVPLPAENQHVFPP